MANTHTYGSCSMYRKCTACAGECAFWINATLPLPLLSMSVSKFALKLTQNVILSDLILNQKSITIKTLYSDTHTHIHSDESHTFWTSHCYIYSRMALAGAVANTNNSHSQRGWLQVKSYFRNSVCVYIVQCKHHEICTHTRVWVTSIQSIYLIAQITLFSFSTANTETAIAIFELVRTHPHSFRQVILFLNRSALALTLPLTRSLHFILFSSHT